MPIEAVIFDLDGTLAHFNLDYKALRGEVRSYFIRNGVPVSVLNVNEGIFDMLTKVQLYVKHKGKLAEAFEDVRMGALAIADKYELDAALTTSLISGAVEVLKELQRMGLKLALCTTSSEKAAFSVLRRFKIEGFFGIVVSRNNVKDVKPSTEQYELALETLNVAPGAAVVVGDSVVDMQGAKEAKTIAVGVPTGMSTMEQLQDYGANYIVTSLADLPVLIKEMNKALPSTATQPTA